METIKVKLKTYGGPYRTVYVSKTGQLPRFPYDIRDAYVHPEYKHIITQLDLPKEQHKHGYECLGEDTVNT